MYINILDHLPVLRNNLGVWQLINRSERVRFNNLLLHMRNGIHLSDKNARRLAYELVKMIKEGSARVSYLKYQDKETHTQCCSILSI